MNENYHIRVDEQRRMLCLTLSGMWTEPSFNACQFELKSILRQLGWSPLSYTVLVDARQHNIQKQEMTERVQRSLSEEEKVINPRRKAVIVSSAIAKMQARRVTHGNDAIFLTEEEALDWLAQTD